MINLVVILHNIHTVHFSNQYRMNLLYCLYTVPFGFYNIGEACLINEIKGYNEWVDFKNLFIFEPFC